MANNPYGDIDFMKLLSDYKIPGFDMEAIMAAQRRNMEALTQANQLALEALQTVLSRQTEVLRETMEESASALRGLLDQSSTDDKVAKQAEMMKVSFEKALANMREVTELVTKSHREACDVINRRVAEGLEEVRTSVTKK
jgi:phasin family protein